MDIEAMKSELREMKMQSNDLRKKIAELSQKIAEAQAKFKTGDRVTYDGSKHVWQIVYIGADHRDEPKYIGNKIKKNGEPAVRNEEIFHPFKSELHLA